MPTAASTRYAIDRGACYVAYEGMDLIATITIDDHADPEFWTPQERADPALYVHRMIVAHDARGRSLGAVLLNWAADLAWHTDRPMLRLDAWKTNDALHRYYTRQGFRHVRTVDLPHRGSGALFERRIA